MLDREGAAPMQVDIAVSGVSATAMKGGGVDGVMEEMAGGCLMGRAMISCFEGKMIENEAIMGGAIGPCWYSGGDIILAFNLV
ncbi:uncharacterized protein M6B38_318900 [Iris pallida]|uniref:Uncharacterized protein n=1 Tax=Iris pallida TaxID=29817 RepID=A0AAX6HCG3_IRIPA|nr:uncharacterized protein M6B38_318900 [Iris pallida]